MTREPKGALLFSGAAGDCTWHVRTPHTAAGNRVTGRRFRCLVRGHLARADINAARNILRAELASGKPKKAT
jgi:transposase